MSLRGNISLYGAALFGSARQLSQPVSHILSQPQASQPALTASQPHPYLHSLKPASHILIQPQASQPHPYTASRQPARSLHSLKLLFHKLCVLELCERNAPLPTPPAWRHFFHTIHTYVIDTGWGGRGQEHTNFKKSEPL